MHSPTGNQAIATPIRLIRAVNGFSRSTFACEDTGR
jgi:hypothetical protein